MSFFIFCRWDAARSYRLRRVRIVQLVFLSGWRRFRYFNTSRVSPGFKLGRMAFTRGWEKSLRIMSRRVVPR